MHPLESLKNRILCSFLDFSNFFPLVEGRYAITYRLFSSAPSPRPPSRLGF